MRRGSVQLGHVDRCHGERSPHRGIRGRHPVGAIGEGGLLRGHGQFRRRGTGSIDLAEPLGGRATGRRVRLADLGSERVGEVHGQWLIPAPTAV